MGMNREVAGSVDHKACGLGHRTRVRVLLSCRGAVRLWESALSELPFPSLKWEQTSLFVEEALAMQGCGMPGLWHLC